MKSNYECLIMVRSEECIRVYKMGLIYIFFIYIENINGYESSIRL